MGACGAKRDRQASVQQGRAESQYGNLGTSMRELKRLQKTDNHQDGVSQGLSQITQMEKTISAML